MTEKKLSLRGVEWEYTTRGGGARALLAFHGAVGGAEGVAWLGEALAGECRTVAPTIRPVNTLREACDAASAILDREHIGRAFVYGDSFGGMLAQAFVRRYPRQAEGLVLLGASAPDPALAERNERLLRRLARLPFWLTRRLVRLDIARHLDVPLPAEAAARMGRVRAHLEHYFDRVLTKEILLARLRLMVDFCRQASYTPEDLDAWPGRVLLIEATDDPTIDATARKRLRALYTRALVCAFPGAGHMIPLLMPEELSEVIRAFIKDDYADPSTLNHCPVEETRHEGR